MIGESVSHYRIVERLGSGGMGEVFLAEDTRLRRKVALKVLRPQLDTSDEARLRFVQEARAAASIEHPHLAAVYDILEDGDRTFIAMEYLRGGSLRQVLGREALLVPRVLDIAIQVGDALAKVHEHGIIHRDLKPENVLLSEDGYPKIIDFGIAKLLEPLRADSRQGSSESDELHTATRIQTGEGRIVGTVAYMSPEQAMGKPIDARSDIFAFGVLVYELLTDRQPFARDSQIETLSAILKDPMPPLELPAGRPPAGLERILEKALSKNREERYSSMRELVEDLKKLRESSREARRPPIAWQVVTMGAVAALAIVLVLSGRTFFSTPAPAEIVRPATLPLLVADFENRTDEPLFDGAMEQALTIGLEGASFITAFDRSQARQIASRLSGAEGVRLDQERAPLVCRSEGIQVAVFGEIEPAGSSYAIRVRAVDPVTAETVAEARTQVAGKAEVLAAADTLSRELRKALGDTSLTAEAEMERETFTTSSLAAMNAYAKAQEFYRQGRYDDAIASYRTAIAADPDFGRAYSGLAVQLGNFGQLEEAGKYFDMALQRLDRMSERERLRTRGAYYLIMRNHQQAVDELEQLVDRYPADSAGLANLALAYFYQRDMVRAMEEGRRSVEVYPQNLLRRNNLALYAMYAGDFASAEREARTVIEGNPDFIKGYVALALSQLAQDRPQEAEETYRRLENVSARGISFGSVGIADVELYRGRLEEAIATLERGVLGDAANSNAEAAARKKVMIAEALLLLGQSERALTVTGEALAGSNDVSVLYPSARIYTALGRRREALGIAERLAGSLQTDFRAYGKLIEGEVERKRGAPLEAIQHYRDAKAIADTWWGRFLLGEAYVEAGAFAEATSELESCLTRRGEATALFLDDVPTYHLFPPVHYYLGRAQEGLGNTAAATGAYRRLVSMKEGGQDPLLNEARRRLNE
jgi:tetratricopeptide (TPR) repeat protein/predicted Ser/Thr protein kinase